MSDIFYIQDQVSRRRKGYDDLGVVLTYIGHRFCWNICGCVYDKKMLYHYFEVLIQLLKVSSLLSLLRRFFRGVVTVAQRVHVRKYLATWVYGNSNYSIGFG